MVTVPMMLIFNLWVASEYSTTQPQQSLAEVVPNFYSTRPQIDTRKCREPHMDKLYSLVNAVCSFSFNCRSYTLSQHIIMT